MTTTQWVRYLSDTQNNDKLSKTCENKDSATDQADCAVDSFGSWSKT